jgi:[ribosomal protein S18]-alanine N-acetyltransferase
LWRELHEASSSERVLLPMTTAHIDAVMTIELAAYPFPWSRGNFIDSLAAGQAAWTLQGEAGRLLGYFVAMTGVEEMHLLNLTVAPEAQSRGHARFMLHELATLCRRQGARKLWLEVRQTNTRARSMYLRLGFAHVGVRKGYYPAALGRREDAVVMSLGLAEAHDAVE